MANYASTSQIQAYAAEPEALESADAWDLLAESASRLFDRLTEVPDDFYAPAGDAYEDRVFYGNGTAYLQLDPFAELNPVNPVTIADSVYEVPEYDIVGGSLVVLNRAARYFGDEYLPRQRFAGWYDGVKVTVSAKWGFQSTPSDVVYAVCQIALLQWRQREPAVAITENLDVSQAALPATAQAVVDKCRAMYSRKAVFA